jgi:hypothetical protein
MGLSPAMTPRESARAHFGILRAGAVVVPLDVTGDKILEWAS